MAAAFLAVMAGEAFCRSFLPAPISIRFQQDVEELEGIGLARLANLFENDSELFWRFAPNQNAAPGSPFFGVISNDVGFREDHSIPIEPLKHEFRIACLGDSCSFGYGIDYRETFIETAEGILEQRLDNPVECINAAVPGYTLFQGWRLFESQVRKYQPDVTVVCFGWNDMVSWDARSDYEHFELLTSAQPVSYLRWSRLCQLAWRTAAQRGEEPEIRRPRLLPGEFRNLLEKFTQAAAEQDSQLLVLVWGFRFQMTERPFERTAWQRQMYQFAAQEPSVRLIDLVPVFQRLARTHGEDGVFLDAGHGTQLAHAAVGQLLAETLLEMRHEVESPRQAATP